MEVTSPFETLVPMITGQSTWRVKLEDGHIHHHRCENLKTRYVKRRFSLVYFHRQD